MLVGTGDPQNVGAFIGGLVFALLGVIFVVNRVRIAAFMTSAQSRFGHLGRRVAREQRPFWAGLVGVGWVVLGTVLVVTGLFAHFDPPGTPR